LILKDAGYHIGHTYTTIATDVIRRFKRMQGYEVLWLPGMDHAGIATQNVVEKKLRKEGKTRYDFTRDDFVSQVWDWANKHKSIINFIWKSIFSGIKSNMGFNSKEQKAIKKENKKSSK